MINFFSDEIYVIEPASLIDEAINCDQLTILMSFLLMEVEREPSLSGELLKCVFDRLGLDIGVAYIGHVLLEGSEDLSIGLSMEIDGIDCKALDLESAGDRGPWERCATLLSAPPGSDEVVKYLGGLADSFFELEEPIFLAWLFGVLLCNGERMDDALLGETARNTDFLLERANFALGNKSPGKAKLFGDLVGSQSLEEYAKAMEIAFSLPCEKFSDPKTLYVPISRVDANC